MILVDTGVWIDYFNGHETSHTDKLDSSLVEGIVAMGDLIFLEILQGFRSNNEFRKAKSTLLTLEQYEMFDKNMALNSADNYRRLRKTGITIRSTVDVIIATFCIEHQLPLLFSDRDFVPFVRQLGMPSVLDQTKRFA